MRLDDEMLKYVENELSEETIRGIEIPDTGATVTISDGRGADGVQVYGPIIATVTKVPLIEWMAGATIFAEGYPTLYLENLRSANEMEVAVIGTRPSAVLAFLTYARLMPIGRSIDLLKERNANFEAITHEEMIRILDGELNEKHLGMCTFVLRGIIFARLQEQQFKRLLEDRAN